MYPILPNLYEAEINDNLLLSHWLPMFEMAIVREVNRHYQGRILGTKKIV